ncbi:ArnT family glycosyltransferase [Pseudobacteroides cellulosolvens]|uniref:Uncharacterized protein n=1 Tax=Pseudobacteroides cellulosolvens ATCC 35603 = DSM 2933 TaxID=398512 RepID=A0A0L6JVI2_9FIRM|nr:glycosyltransferase family 39 protein [Pseudobacteroides cellulosolvens]KNY29650.1 hypothetical protein Bccel_4924 [Pseudobacteroides cellulosolvens ATCC 35603 = DSM 2933]
MVKETTIDMKVISVLLLLPVAIFIGFASSMRGTEMVSALIVLSSIVFISMGLIKSKETGLVIVLYLAFITRLVLAILNSFYIHLPDSGTDAVAFEDLGWKVAQAWENGAVPPDTPGAYLYSKFVGLIYFLTGRSPFVAQFFNVIFGFFTVYFVYKLVVEIGGSKKAALTGSLVAALFPTLNLYSAVILRENVITLLSLISVYYFIKWVKGGLLYHIVLSVILLTAASSVHGAMIFVGGVYLFFFSFYKPATKQWKLINKEVVIAIVLTLVVMVFFRSRLLNKLPADISLIFSPEYLKSRLIPLAVGRTAYLQGFYPASIIDIVIHTPIRIIYFLLMPFLWKVSGVFDIIGFVDAAFYAVLIFFCLKSIRKAGCENKILFIALFAIMLIEILTFAWGTSNYGTAIRHRQKIVCLLIALASVGRYGMQIRINKKDKFHVNEKSGE